MIDHSREEETDKRSCNKLDNTTEQREEWLLQCLYRISSDVDESERNIERKCHIEIGISVFDGCFRYGFFG